ncbi:MAG: hypothetical protein A2X94_07155 [Bdellovibrionales bacterium GWB1_55_8]|nr:MAG: hypothetical protein A2X94_07155 [Bdellovibrionales bacterium GWB1_55_8]
MKSKFVLALFVLALSSSALALETREITIKADTDYRQTVWTAVGLQRAYSANVLPANPQVADALGALSFRNTYVCRAQVYLGTIGYFNQDGERPVAMVYSLSNCQKR